MRISWLVIALLALNTSVSRAAPAAANAVGLQETLQDRLTYVYGPVWATGDAAKFVDEILTHDAVITAADGPKVWKGRTQSLDLVKELLKAYSTITPKAVYTQSLGPNAALQFVVFEATANDAAHTKSTAKSLCVGQDHLRLAGNGRSLQLCRHGHAVIALPSLAASMATPTAHEPLTLVSGNLQ